ncbi:hypothetical protein JQK62_21805 [Leptospira santarosai]|nr:hypothetical protein [Leptospira santarosai]
MGTGYGEAADGAEKLSAGAHKLSSGATICKDIWNNWQVVQYNSLTGQQHLLQEQ